MIKPKLKLPRPRRKPKHTSITTTPDDLLIAITNNLSGAVIVINSDQKIFHYNAAALDLLNTNVDLKNRPISDILALKTKDNKSFNIAAHIQKTLTPTTLDDLRLGLDAEDPIRLELRISPIRNNFKKGKTLISGYVLFLRDITAAKTFEEEQSEFIGFVSHELRTPTATIEGALSNLALMVKSPGPVDKTAFTSALATAHHQIKSLSDLINSLSALSHAERKDIDTPSTPVNIKDLIERLCSEHTPLATKKSLKLTLDQRLTDPIAHTHCPYLEEIIRNFLTNAIKYTERGGITLTASDTPESITISVADTGIGITSADQKRILEKFYRVENHQTRKTEGIGLGLYIALKLAKKLGGELTVSSRLKHGSTFSIIIPRMLQ